VSDRLTKSSDGTPLHQHACLEWHVEMTDWWVIILQFQGPFTGPLEPSQNRCFAGAARSFRWASPLGPHRNSTTAPDTAKSYIPCLIFEIEKKMKLKKCIFEKPKYKYKEDIKIRTLQHIRDSVIADNDYFLLIRSLP